MLWKETTAVRVRSLRIPLLLFVAGLLILHGVDASRGRRAALKKA